VAVNPMDYSGKDTVLDVVRTERGRFYNIIDNPDNWSRPTRSGHWEVRDLVGHMIDVTEGYLDRWEMARRGEPAEALGLVVMASELDRVALSHRSLPREEAIARLKADSDKMLSTFDALTPEEWGGFNVTHIFMGPLPTFFYPAFQLMDYGVHSWDVRQGTGKAHGLTGEVGDLLMPFMFVLWQYTVADSSPEPCELGIRITSGPNAGDTRVTVGPDGMSYEAGDASDLTVIEFDPGSFVLTAFGRSNSGSIRGDRAVADQYLNLFFRI